MFYTCLINGCMFESSCTDRFSACFRIKGMINWFLFLVLSSKVELKKLLWSLPLPRVGAGGFSMRVVSKLSVGWVLCCCFFIQNVEFRTKQFWRVILLTSINVYRQYVIHLPLVINDMIFLFTVTWNQGFTSKVLLCRETKLVSILICYNILLISPTFFFCDIFYDILFFSIKSNIRTMVWKRWPKKPCPTTITVYGFII